MTIPAGSFGQTRCLCVDLVPCCLGLSIVLAGSADPPSPLVMDLKPGIIVFPDRLCVSDPPVASGCVPLCDL